MTTWDPSSQLLNVTLSSGNLTATTTESSKAGACSTTSKSSGKYYFEATLLSSSTTFEGVGIQTSTFDISTSSNILGFDDGPKSVNVRANGDFEIQNGVVGVYGSLITNDIVGIAIDFDGSLIWARRYRSGSWNDWNNNGSADPAASTGGVSISSIGVGPFFIGYGSNAANESYTLDPNGSVGPIPAGFSAWDAAPPAPNPGAMGILIVA